MMIKPTGRKKEVLDRMRDINLTYRKQFEQCYEVDSMELDVDKAPQEFKKIAIEYNELHRELLNLPKESVFINKP